MENNYINLKVFNMSLYKRKFKYNYRKRSCKGIGYMNILLLPLHETYYESQFPNIYKKYKGLYSVQTLGEKYLMNNFVNNR